ncbi:response regulator [Ruminococcus sp. 5_1_39BFAA]|uniref:response regulator transcription factor n=1 Tax=Ruminococcus sp. 5_1_39BFAA TaxID=457412 RepID=UPI0035645131
MKLLIVDDEELTRTGVISSLDWKALGIDEVIQADDGINGLEMAKKHKPEIILCDVRMPRMDGITMLERLDNILPDVVPIFMSGYSDKEYLKAAIKLKAVNYIEKPIDPKEIRDAVSEARELYNQKVRTHRGETFHSMETASRLALLLTAPYDSNREAITQLTEELNLPITSTTCFTAIIIKIDTSMDYSASSEDKVYQEIRDFLGLYRLDCIYVEKRMQYLVYFVFGPALTSETILESIRDVFCRQYSSYRKFYLAAGETVQGISRAYQSYTSGVILLQSSFFFPIGIFLSSRAAVTQEPSGSRPTLPSNPMEVFQGLLDTRDEKGSQDFLQTLQLFYDRNKSVLPNQAKDLYYRLFRCVEDVSMQLQITSGSEPENVIDTLENIFSFQELHEKLCSKTEQFFKDASSNIQENATIFLIKDYISKNYMNETLSVKDISKQVFLSTSYVCTFFKNETGQTLNQYLTEYRMEKAKQLLANPLYKIADISSKVGYSDGNYFGKSFKKYTGLSPSEYREKLS